MSLILLNAIAHDDFAPKFEAALETAVRQKRLRVEDVTADPETVEVEHFRMTSRFQVDQDVVRAGELYVPFRATCDVSVRYRDLSTGQEERTSVLFVKCEGYAQFMTPYYDPKEDEIADVAARLPVEIPIKDLVLRPK